MWSPRVVLVTALFSLLLWDFAVTLASEPEQKALCSKFKELRDRRTGDSAEHIGTVLYDVHRAFETYGGTRKFAQWWYNSELEMGRWLEERECVRSSSRHRAKELALSCALDCDRMWFGWSDDTAVFLNRVAGSRVVTTTFPLLISLNRDGWALMSANKFVNQYSLLGCAVNPQRKRWKWVSPKRWAKASAKGVSELAIGTVRCVERVPEMAVAWLESEYWPFYVPRKGLADSDACAEKPDERATLSSKSISQLANVANGYLGRVQVELADWMGAERRPMGSSLDDATRAQIVEPFLQSLWVNALTISWNPHPGQPNRKHAKTLGAMVTALARRTSEIEYLAISDLNQKAVDPPTNERLLSALYSAVRKTGRETAQWSTLREFSVTVKSYGLDQKSNSPNLYDELRRLLELMPSLRHFNINVDHPMRPTRSEISNLVGNRRGVSYSIADESAFIGIAPAAKLHQFDREGEAILLSLPSIDPSNSGDQVCNVQHIQSGLLGTTAALTLFVKQSFCENRARELGRAISSGKFPILERLAIDGRWSAVEDVNNVLLQMKPKLPASVTHALIRPVSLRSNNAKEVMMALHDMLINSKVETLALTVILPRDILGKQRAPYANQLVDTLTRMARLTRLDLTLSTRADPEAEAAAETISRHIRAKLPFARVTHHRLTETWTEPDCRSTEPFPAFDAFSSELSDRLKSIARCAPPTLDFPMPHHFSGAFDYRTHGQVERLLDDDASGQMADSLDMS